MIHSSTNEVSRDLAITLHSMGCSYGRDCIHHRSSKVQRIEIPYLFSVTNILPPLLYKHSQNGKTCRPKSKLGGVLLFGKV